MNLDDTYDEDHDMPTMKQRPKQTFQVGSLTPANSTPPTPTAESPPNYAQLQLPKHTMDGSSTPSRTRSILNLTSSTLFGIYAPTGYAADREEPSTPWGTGAETPADSRNGSFDLSRSSLPDIAYQRGRHGMKLRRRSVAPTSKMASTPRRGFRWQVLPIIARTAGLAIVGVLYALLISHLHDRQHIAPVPVDGIDRSTPTYFAFWAAGGAVLGQAMPVLDAWWDADEDEVMEDEEEKHERPQLGWIEGVRAITAFIGIAFAIRKLPWQSTLQLSLTLALANPAVWYLIDRSASGFVLSTAVAIGGTIVLLLINPALLPSPTPGQILRGHVAKQPSGNATTGSVDSDQLILGLLSLEAVGVATWIASVLFVSSVCFGNIGRRLVPQRS